MSTTAPRRTGARPVDSHASGPRAARRLTWRVWPVLLPLLVVCVLVLDYVVALVRPGTAEQLWLLGTLTTGFPIWFAGFALLAVAATTLLIAVEFRPPAAVVDSLLVLECFAAFLGTRISPMTGDQAAWLEHANGVLVPTSEPLAAVVYKVAYAAGGGPGALRFVAPLAGAAAITTLLVLARALAPRLRIDPYLLRAFVFATPVMFWYVSGYIENTFLALPTFFLAMAAMLRWQDRGHRPRDLALVAALLGVTVTFHGEFLFLLPFAALWVFLQSWGRPALGVRDLALAAVTGSVVIGAVLAVIGASGLRLVVGAATGGYDNAMFTPLALRPGDSLSRFTFFSHAHLIQSSNIVVQTAPGLVLAVPVVLLLVLWRRRDFAILGVLGADPTLRWLGLLSTGYLVFISLWGFDFGMVGDLDLMLTMSAPLSLFVLGVSARLLESRPRLLLGLIVASACANFGFYSFKVATVWWQ